MRRAFIGISLLAAAACGKEKAAAPPATQQAAAGPRAIVTVIYNTPKDPAAFEKYYADVHVPLVVANQAEIGFVRADLTKFPQNLDGSPPAYYRQAELYFNSMADLEKGIATPGFKKVADDLANFATGGLTAMVGEESSPPDDATQAEPMAIVTVLYNTPKDPAAFEKYYAEVHLPLVAANQSEIGFVKAELTKFPRNLDGSAPAFYRQAELYFPSMDALKKGITTPGFKKVADDLPNFATGGLTAIVAGETK